MTGSADLTPSNNTKFADEVEIQADNFSGRYIHWGIREHGMIAACNGIALHGGFIPSGASFFCFTDYCRPSLRLSALMGIRVVNVFTHDSIGLGEDGPTHQPVEHLASLRAMPNFYIWRPADSIETVECWQAALEREHSPSILALTRQSMPAVRLTHVEENLCARGGYEVSPASGEAQVSIFASGSEVSLAVAAQAQLKEKGVAARVVSMPCFPAFFEQPEDYRRSVIGNAKVRVGVEAAVRFGWDAIIGDGPFIGMKSFGESGPYKAVYKHFGITPEAVVEAALSKLKRLIEGLRRRCLRLHFHSGHWSRGSDNKRGFRDLNCRGVGGRSGSAGARGEIAMVAKVAINGFGRIGRLVLRGILESGRKDIEVVAINDLGPVETNAHLLRYDSVHGRFPHKVKVEGDTIVIGGHKIKVTAIKDPAELPHKALGVDIALECTGIFTARDKAAAHLKAGAKRVLISAPAEGADLTVVYGVNDDKLTKDHLVVSNASCTTNCLAPVVKVLNDAIGIEHGFMTTIHSYTGDQPTLDTMHKDLYRARGAALSMIPTTTGAAKAVGLVLPELKGKLDGSSIRVPTPNVSVVDLKFVAKRKTSADEINNAIKTTADGNGPLKGILGYTDEPNVSSDFNHDDRSSIFHLDQTKVIDGDFVRVLSWYDNEWGFSNRMADTAVAMAKLI